MGENENQEEQTKRPLLVQNHQTSEYTEDSHIVQDSVNDNQGDGDYVPMKQTFWRWVILALVITFVFGNYFLFSLQGSLQKTLTINLKTDEKGYNLIQTSYSFPNMVLPLFAGVLVDKLGYRIGLFGYTLAMLIGSFLMYIANVHHNFSMFLGGMVCFGIGSEAMCIILSAYISNWFIGKELAISLGFVPAMASFSQVASSWLGPYLVKSKDVAYAFLWAFIFMAVGFVCITVTCVLDKFGEEQDKKHAKPQTESQLKKQSNQKINYKELAKILFWTLNLLYMFQTAVYATLNANLVGILTKFYQQSDISAPRIVSITVVMCTVITPAFAWVTDKYGKKGEILILACILQVVAVVLWMVLPTGTSKAFYLSIAVTGIYQSLLGSVIYPAIPLVIPEKLLGTAFAIQDCIQQVGMALAPLMVGWLEAKEADNTENYVWTYVFFLALAGIGLFFAIFSWIYDKKNGYRLNMLEIQGEDEDVQTNNHSSVHKSKVKKSRLNKCSFGQVLNKSYAKQLDDEQDNLLMEKA